MEFNLQHLLNIKKDESWVDCGKGLVFTGREAFVSSVQGRLRSTFNPLPKDPKAAIALVYTSVSGTGKTVSMLELKAKLPKYIDGVPVVVAYLGFNVALGLNSEEVDHISRYLDRGAEDVLARRLAGATIISMEYPDSVTDLPSYSTVYNGYNIPSYAKSFEVLLAHTGRKPIYIIAGVDEVQLLNQIRCGTVTLLGRLFLRILRQWQCVLHENGVRLLPLGTGIAIDWSADETTGRVLPLFGEDSTLISKHDFHVLVEKVVGSLRDDDLTNRFSDNTSKETVVDLISAFYWPRVRLLEWWRDKKEKDYIRSLDPNFVQWVQWLCYWLRDEPISVENTDLIPGKGDGDGRIHCLFELSQNALAFSVIPDGYASKSIVNILKIQLLVPRLYEGLDVVTSLDPKHLILKDNQAFENVGFHVVGSAMHIGLHALGQQPAITLASASRTQRKRLGVALWLLDRQAVVRQETGGLYVPAILGPVDAMGEYGAFYPFATQQQTSFEPEVAYRLQKSAIDCTPVYIRCGQLTCCDYLYFYLRHSPNGKTEFICNICDAKHTRSGALEKKNIVLNDQTKLFRAVTNVTAAVEAINLNLRDVRLLFVTNRKGIAKPRSQTSNSTQPLIAAKHAAQSLFPDVELELLNEETFEFGPFSDILMTRRKSRYTALGMEVKLKER